MKDKKKHVPFWVRVRTGSYDGMLSLAAFFSIFTVGPFAQRGITKLAEGRKKVSIAALIGQILFVALIITSIIAAIISLAT